MTTREDSTCRESLPHARPEDAGTRLQSRAPTGNMAPGHTGEPGETVMDVRAAVAHRAGAPLAIETVRLDGPKAGEAEARS